MPTYEYTCESCSNEFTNISTIASRKDDKECPSCGGLGKYRISCPTISLDGTDPGFPGAYANWDKKRKQKLAQEQKARREHGDGHQPGDPAPV